MEITEMISQRGTVMKVIDGFKFAFGASLSNSLTKYRCARNGCKAYAKFDASGVLVESWLDHNHPQEDKSVLLRQQVSNTLKRKAIDELHVGPSKLLTAAKDYFNVRDMTRRDIQYVRRVVYRARSNRRPKSAQSPNSSSEGNENVDKPSVARRGSGTSSPSNAREADNPTCPPDDIPAEADFKEVLVKPEVQEHSLGPGEPSTSSLEPEFDFVTIKNEIDDTMMTENSDPLADEESQEAPPEDHFLAADDLAYFQSLAANLNKLSLDQKMIFRIKVGNILQELVAA